MNPRRTRLPHARVKAIPRLGVILGLAMLSVLGVSRAAVTGVIQISITNAGVDSEGACTQTSVSDDGRFVAFDSTANDLSEADGGQPDVLVRDRDSDGNGEFDEPGGVSTRLISNAPSVGGADGDPAISGDGSFVAFWSTNNYPPPTENGFGATDIYVRRSDGLVPAELVTRSKAFNIRAGQTVRKVAINRNGRFVVFESQDSELITWTPFMQPPPAGLDTNDTNGLHDVFVRDRDVNGNGVFGEPDDTETRRVSQSAVPVAPDNVPEEPDGGPAPAGSDFDISDDGRFIVFLSRFPNLTSPPEGSPNSTLTDVYLRDRDTDEDAIFNETGAESLTLISQGAIPGVTARGHCKEVAISADARCIAFVQTATLQGEPPGRDYVFVHDRDPDNNEILDEPGTATTVLVSRAGGGAPANDVSHGIDISGDGRFVGFLSTASNLVPGDGNIEDVFLHDRDTDADGIFDEPAAVATVIVNTIPPSLTNTGMGGFDPGADVSISAAGRHITFATTAGHLEDPDDTNSDRDAFLVNFQPEFPPVANAGLDQGVGIPHDGNPATDTVQITLDGSASFDPNGPPISFAWRNAVTGTALPGGTTATVLLNLAAGEHRFILRVTDPTGRSAEAETKVNVFAEPNASPMARAGSNQAVTTAGATAQVQLDGSASSDPDGDVLAMDKFKWFANAVQIAQGATPTVTLAIGNHNLTLEVTDAYGAKGMDTVEISVQPAPTFILSGKVSFEGTGLPGVTLSTDTGQTTTTDAGGLFEFPPLPSATYVVTPSLSGFSFNPPSAMVVLTTNVFQEFEAAGGYVLSGRVTLGGIGMPAMPVSTNHGQEVLTDGTGHYQFPPLPGGTYVVTVLLTGFNFSPASPTVNLTSSTTQNFTATGTGGRAQSINIAFGTVKVGSTKTKSALLRNTHRTQPLVMYMQSLPGAPFVLMRNGVPIEVGKSFSIPARGSVQVIGTFSPTARGSFTRSAGLLTSDPGKQSVTVRMTGKGK